MHEHKASKRSEVEIEHAETFENRFQYSKCMRHALCLWIRLTAKEGVSENDMVPSMFWGIGT